MTTLKNQSCHMPQKAKIQNPPTHTAPTLSGEVWRFFLAVNHPARTTQMKRKNTTDLDNTPAVQSSEMLRQKSPQPTTRHTLP